jgi:hypothetical protein
MEALVFKSIDYFNQQLEEQGRAIRFKGDKQHFNIRIAKKKNGKPNTDYPSKFLLRYQFICCIEVDLTQQIADIDFSNFCLMYTVDGVVNLINQTLGGASSHKSKGLNAGSPTGLPSPGNAFIKDGKILLLIHLDTKMIQLHKSSSHSVLENNNGHCGSISDSETMRGGIPLSTAG